MKSDVNTNSRFAQRTLEAFSKTTLSLLEKKGFEDISINEICELSNYPRSTFYNYFEDIFDLLDYCWDVVYSEICSDEDMNVPHKKQTGILFELLYDYMNSVRSNVQRIVSHNAVDGKMCESLKKNMRSKIYQMILNCSQSDEYPLPAEVVAEHYANTIWMVLEHCFLYHDTLTKAEAISAIDYLLGTLEQREETP